MSTVQFYNVKNVDLILGSNASGYASFDAIQGGMDDESQMGWTPVTDQATSKEDITGNYGFIAIKNSKKCDVSIICLPGTPLCDFLFGIWHAQRELDLDVSLNASFKHPLIKKAYQWQGVIVNEPAVTVQGELDPIEFTLMGFAESKVTPA